MIKIWELSLSPVFLKGPSKSMQWFDSYFLTNSGSSNITARATGSLPSMQIPCEFTGPVQNWRGELLPHPSWPVLPSSASIPLLCRAQARRAKETFVSIFVAKCCFQKHASKPQWSLLFWSQLLAEERSGSRQVLGASSSTFLGYQGYSRSDLLPEVNMGRFV